MATIQASFANAAEFFNSLLGVEHQYAWRLARTRPATPAGAAALIKYVLDDDPVTEEEILAHDRAQDRGCGTQQHGRGGGLMSSPLDTFGVQEVFCEALARIDRIGPNRRLVFVITSPSTDGGREQVAVLKIALSAEAAFQAAQAILNDGGQPLAALESVATTWAN